MPISALKLLPAIALVVARHAESRCARPRQYCFALRHSGAFALNRIHFAQRGVTEDLCKAAAPSCLYAF